MIARHGLRALTLACALVATTARADDRPQPDTWTPFSKSRLVPPLILGARAAETTTRVSDPTQGISAFVYMSGYAPLLRLTTTMRAGKSYGAEGKLAVDVAIGPSYEVFEKGFLFARFGARGQLEGNDLFTVNELEPLQAQLGLQYIGVGSVPVLFELAGRGSLSSGAYVAVADFTRRFKPAPAWGTHFALSIGPVRAEAVFTQILPTGASRAALDIAEIIGCVRAGVITLCADHSQTFTGLFGPSSYYRDKIAMTGFTFGTSLR